MLGWYTPTDIATTIQSVSGKPAVFQEVDDQTFRGFMPQAVGEELMETFMLIRDFGYYGGRGGEDLGGESKGMYSKLAWYRIGVRWCLCMGQGQGAGGKRVMMGIC